MQSRRPFITAIVAGAVGVVCFFISIKDGGNADFYWKPMLVIWYVLTAIALVPLRNKAGFAWLRDRWWLQLATPVVLLVLALLFVRVYEPFPLKHATKRANSEGRVTRQPSHNPG